MARSRLLDTIAFIYYWQPEEVADLESDLLERRISIWIQKMRTLAQQHGCSKQPNPPRLEDLAELRRMSDEDARSISTTWQRDVDNQLQRLFNNNRRGNRFYYISNMEQWAAERGAWKNLQIGLYTEQSTVYYVTNRFRVMNGLRGQRYIYQGPAPVGEECVRRSAAGIVTEGYVQTHPTPVHPNCPHQWQALNPAQIPCDEMWTG